MMNANELRIGNWIFDSEDAPHYFQIEEIKIVSDNLHAVYRNGSTTCAEPQPIPLTEEILLKCGFEENSAGDYVLNDFLLGYITEDDNIQYEHTNPLMKWGIINVLYVHQLQNLYFALTGEELIINI